MLPKHTTPIPRIFVPSYILAKDGDYSEEGFRIRKDNGYYREIILHDIIKPSESQPNISFLIEDVNEDPLGRYVEGAYNFNPFDQKYAPNRLRNPLMNIIICDATQYFYNNINHYSPGNFVAWRTCMNLLPHVVINSYNSRCLISNLSLIKDKLEN